MHALAVGIGAVVALLCFVAAVRILYKGYAVLRVSTTTSDWNSDDVAVEHFMSLLNEAEDGMVVYDDGNDMEGSIYKSARVIDAVRLKLTDNPAFKLSCHFNFDESLPFTQQLGVCSGVRISTGRGVRPDDDVHYKIIDGGRKAHLSRQALASKERRFQVIDNTDVPEGELGHVTDIVLGPYKDHAVSCGIWDGRLDGRQ